MNAILKPGLRKYIVKNGLFYFHSDIRFGEGQNFLAKEEFRNGTATGFKILA